MDSENIQSRLLCWVIMLRLRETTRLAAHTSVDAAHGMVQRHTLVQVTGRGIETKDVPSKVEHLPSILSYISARGV